MAWERGYSTIYSKVDILYIVAVYSQTNQYLWWNRITVEGGAEYKHWQSVKNVANKDPETGVIQCNIKRNKTHCSVVETEKHFVT